MVLLEAIVEVIIIGVITLTGIFVRWFFAALMQLTRGRQVASFRQYSRKMTSDKNPSNRMSDGIIHWILGAAIWLGAVLLFKAML
jgi:hypothetical protein